MRKFALVKLPDEQPQEVWTLKLKSRPGIPRALLPFLQSSGEFTKLAETLKANPGLLWHPLVYRVIRHLRDVAAAYREDLLEYEADVALRQLVEGAASGLLGGAWSLKRTPGCPGRPAKCDEDIDLGPLDDSERLMESLRKETLRKQKNESDADRAGRVAQIVQRVWERSSLSTEQNDEPLETDKHETIEERLRRPIRWRAVPLAASEEVLGWVKKAYEQSRKKGRPVRSQLVWKMLAHRYKLTEGQVRGRIDTARAWRKEWM